MVSIIDYDAGNVRSVENILRVMGQEYRITSSAEEILSADRIILPGVGAFGDAMEKLTSRGLVEVIHEAVHRNIPFLGICLGQQLLFEESEESPGVRGLSLLPGRIVRIPEGDGRKVPQIGWNELVTAESDGASADLIPSRLLAGLPAHSFFYFVHSYYLPVEDTASDGFITSYCEYGENAPVKIGASVEHGNVFGCQFHPEKSGTVGRKLLENFISL